MTTLNIGAYKHDKWGDVKLDIKEYQPGMIVFDLNSGKPLPFREGEFDEIRCWSVLDILVNPQFIINECRRVLKPGGRISVRITNVESKRFWIRPLKDRYLHGGQDWAPIPRYNFFDEHTLRNRFALGKFREARTYTDYGVFPFHDMLYLEAIK